MAAKEKKPTFINENSKVAGVVELQNVIGDNDHFINECTAQAQEAIKANDRKGVLLLMKGAEIAERTNKSLERAIARAQRYRLTKDEREAFNKDGSLPAGIKQVVIENDGDDDDDDDATD